MHDETRAAAQNRVELILAGNGEALVAAGLVARKAVAVVPAPRTLVNVAGECADIAHLLRGHRFRGFGENCVVATDERVMAEGIERDEAADVDAGVRRRDLVEPFDRFQIDQHVR
jgi:hypothetical protein